MLIVLLAFAVVFFCRDVQVLTTAACGGRGTRFACYAVFILAAVAIADSSLVNPWTRKRIAMAAILTQLAELGLALVLRKWKGGRHRWIGSILPCPAFLVVILALSCLVRQTFRLDPGTAAEIVMVCWLSCVGGMALLLRETVDRRFADDFALMTGCTVLIFLPGGIFP